MTLVLIGQVDKVSWLLGIYTGFLGRWSNLIVFLFNNGLGSTTQLVLFFFDSQTLQPLELARLFEPFELDQRKPPWKTTVPTSVRWLARKVRWGWGFCLVFFFLPLVGPLGGREWLTKNSTTSMARRIVFFHTLNGLLGFFRETKQKFDLGKLASKSGWL